MCPLQLEGRKDAFTYFKNARDSLKDPVPSVVAEIVVRSLPIHNAQL
jgi:hypothetical protein